MDGMEVLGPGMQKLWALCLQALVMALCHMCEGTYAGERALMDPNFSLPLQECTYIYKGSSDMDGMEVLGPGMQKLWALCLQALVMALCHIQ